MNSTSILLIVLLAPFAFILTALYSWIEPGKNPSKLKKIGLYSSIISLLSAVAAASGILNQELIESALLGMNDLGLSIRLDSISVMMFGMIAILAFVIMRFSFNYLEGDANQGRFIGRLAATIASVQLLVLSGNLFLLLLTWVLTSNSLHRLLIFYPDRPGAIISAKKKYLVARLGDLCFTAAIVLLYSVYETGQLTDLFASIENGNMDNSVLVYASILLAITALLKSAQLPSHGWLVEVMETPTPVSALLHAGLLNAGPFLIIRLSPIFEATSAASLLLIFVGGLTALFASTVYLSQSSIKTALAYSSIAHMGFSLMVCGLGVYAAALLHLIAHSFYKAHSFLSSGSVIDKIRAQKVNSPSRLINPGRIIMGIILALGLYLALANAWGLSMEKDGALIAIGAILVLGLSKLFAEALDSNSSIKLLFRASLLSLGTALSFFILESLFHQAIASQAPMNNMLSGAQMILMISLLGLFSLVVFIQVWSPALKHKPVFKAAIVHLRNGLYINTLFDNVIGAQKIKAARKNQGVAQGNVSIAKKQSKSEELILE